MTVPSGTASGSIPPSIVTSGLIFEGQGRVDVFGPSKKDGKWRYRNVAANGETENVSQAYASKSNAKRAANKQANGRSVVIVPR